MTRDPLGPRERVAFDADAFLPMDTDIIRSRLRAARALAGLSVEQLAERLGERGLSAGTLYNIERGARGIQRWQLNLIAEACGIHPSFFEVDFTQALDGSGTAAEVVQAVEESHRLVLRHIEDASRARVEDFGRAMERVSRVERMLEEVIRMERTYIGSLDQITRSLVDRSGTRAPSPQADVGTPPEGDNPEERRSRPA